MTTQEKINNFLEADRKVTEIENNISFDTIHGTTKEHSEAIETAQNLYYELEAEGIDPFAN